MRNHVQNRQTAYALATAGGALLLWYFCFVFPWGNFWVKMAFSASTLAVISLAAMSGRERELQLTPTPRHVLVGAATAAVLYFVFVLGNWLLPKLLPSAASEIPSVYALGRGTSLYVISFLLLFVTGPAEEIYWRGFLQKRLSERWGAGAGLVVSTCIYAFVHIWTFNLSLILAAFTVGLAWGLLYQTQKSLVPSIVSHALWGFVIFVLFPVA